MVVGRRVVGCAVGGRLREGCQEIHEGICREPGAMVRESFSTWPIMALFSFIITTCKVAKLEDTMQVLSARNPVEQLHFQESGMRAAVASNIGMKR